MPDGGDLRDVQLSQRQDAQVRVFAVPPREDARPDQIVRGFLEALTSDDLGYETARKYLTTRSARTWRPELSTTVLANGPVPEPSRSDRWEKNADELTYTLSGSRVAAVDAQQAYAPADGEYHEVVTLRRDARSGQWRIDRLPQGIVMGQSDFHRNYSSVSRYYFPASTADGGGRQHAVADPVQVRKVDPLTGIVRALLAGPTGWLSPAVRTRFPSGTALSDGVTSLTPDDEGKLTVPLNAAARAADHNACEMMAAQTLLTLQGYSPTGVKSVELKSGERRLCGIDEKRTELYAPRGSGNPPEYLYFVDGEHRLVRIDAEYQDVPEPDDATSAQSEDAEDQDASQDTGQGAAGQDADPSASPGDTAAEDAARAEAAGVEPVPGVFGTGTVPLRSVAVSRDEHTVAGVHLDGSRLYVGPLAADGENPGEPVLKSTGSSESDRLTAPSWDARGDLWIADREPGDPRLLMLPGGTGKPVEVSVPELEGRVEAVRVAADGVRIALVVAKEEKRSLWIGRIDRRHGKDGTKNRLLVSVVDPRAVAPRFEDVAAMSWAGPDRLVVAGREQGGVQQMRYVRVDGSAVTGVAPAALSGVREIAASEDEESPLTAFSGTDGLVRLPSGAQWKQIVRKAMSPVYPG
ncbi:LpqB family beta-propeller domain-containing protein [Streptomyces fragilis]|uniref:LpqB family beta-propeller domain-containing protein n=1 Tax=Streptomyces fragilis TaxID=67301 RepID=A0ABV2YDW6_9ACTN|nr:LpqB family beta-propeller domain-containing protein [Streptomyces fragilis]